MGRLIDEDELYEDLANSLSSIMGDGSNGEAIDTYVIIGDIIHDTLDKQATAYDVDKVVEQLEEEREYSHADFEQYAELHSIDTEEDWFYAGLKRAIEIVKRGGENEEK